ncbi:MAG: hypothetical protein ACI4AE_02070 [Candidatus Cryptobacteroides sp.]
MNKSTFALAALALIAASCTKTEVVGSGPETSGSGINFSAYTAKPTKATQTDVTTDNFTSFNVTALGKGAIYFDNVKFEKNATSGVWESTPQYFWPAFALDFYAYNTPEKGDFTRNIDANNETLTFAPSSTLAEQEDLVAAYADDQTLAKTENNLATKLTFNHYLTQVIVKAKNSNLTYKVEVDGVKFANLAGEGTYSFSTNKMVANAEKVNKEASSDYKATFTATELSGTEKEVMTNEDNGRWYLIPQEVKPWDQANNKDNASVEATNYGTYLALKVKITAKNGNLKLYPASGDESAWMAVPVPVAPDATKFTLAQGKKYTFIINFFSDNSKSGAGFVDPEMPGDLDGDNQTNDAGKPIVGSVIKFSAEVNEWDETNTEITIYL